MKMKEDDYLLLVLVSLGVLCACVAAVKECGNIPVPYTPRTYTSWGKIEVDLETMYRNLRTYNGVFQNSSEAKGFLKEVSLQDVRVSLDSIWGRAQKTNLEYMLMFDTDRMIWNFRKTAGLDAPGTPYGGWEDPKEELRGHFVGHYLSASALMWASTGNEDLKQKMTAMVNGLALCQQKIGTGYLSAFPAEFFDRVELVQPVWAPYYTIHKILAGLLDQYTVAGNPQALKILTWMVDYFYNRVINIISKYSLALHYASLNTEFGGMNDVLYKLFTITGDQKHLLLAHLFDKPCFLGPLAMQVSDLADLHTNTHIPVLIGAQMRYEVTGDPLYKDMGIFFMNLVNSSHAYATGGTSIFEGWRDPMRMAENLKAPENEESCTTYNMLKVSRHLFRWTKEVTYADYYERALTNGVLSIQRGTEPGVMIYMLPLGTGVSKAISYHGWGTPFNTFWCCYGTGIESFSKLGDSIYFEEEAKGPTLYIIQYISSTFDWKSGNIMINQIVDPVVSLDPFLRVTFTFSPSKNRAVAMPDARFNKNNRRVVKNSGGPSTLKFRLPSWTRNGAKATINGQNLPLPNPGTYLTVTRQWNAGQKLTLELPITIKTEAIKDDRPEFASLQAVLYGPFLLAGHTTGDADLKARANLAEWITPINRMPPGSIISLSQNFANSTFAVTNKNQSLTMQLLPAPNTDRPANASFRLVPKDPSLNISAWTDAISKPVMLEPFNLPGMSLMHQGPNQPLVIADRTKVGPSSFFIVAKGLDGQNGTLSLQPESKNGCYVSTGLSAGAGVTLNCNASGDAIKQSASFMPATGLAQYDPISFVAKGVNRDFLLEPLFTFKDDPYTVYFNFKS